MRPKCYECKDQSPSPLMCELCKRRIGIATMYPLQNESPRPVQAVITTTWGSIEANLERVVRFLHARSQRIWNPTRK